MNEPVFWIAPLAALLAMIFAWIFYKDMVSQDQGTERMKEIGEHVRQGSMAYLRQQYKIMALV
ncbi:MAG: hypothetical protein EOM91_12225, partial [Sphingobacteriia bacterium]|nr:hypothetical protein [Sphingobacteriia bacterium]